MLDRHMAVLHHKYSVDANLKCIIKVILMSASNIIANVFMVKSKMIP